jgi:hypothetical protein
MRQLIIKLEMAKDSGEQWFLNRSFDARHFQFYHHKTLHFEVGLSLSLAGPVKHDGEMRGFLFWN